MSTVATNQRRKSRPAHPFSRRFWCDPVDLMSLGLVRITVSLMLVLVLLQIAPLLPTMLTDSGVFPRATLFQIPRPAHFSVFNYANSVAATWLLWASAVAAAGCLLVGWQTRWAALITFVLLSGMQERNTFLFDGSDTVLRVMLFWLLFLPIGHCYSLDARLAAKEGRPLPSTGHPFCIRLAQLQFCWIYSCTFICKISDSMWRDGIALHYAFGLEHLYTRALGARLFNVTWLIVSGTYGTLAVEALFAFLIFIPFGQPRAKAGALWAGALMHLGILATMDVGNFSLMMLACYPLLFESSWTERLVAACRAQLPGAVSLPPLDGSLPRPKQPATRAPTARAWVWVLWSARFALAGLLGCVVVSTLPSRESKAGFVEKIVHATELWQRWNLFAPKPLQSDSYLASDVELADGRTLDALAEPTGVRPALLGGQSSHRWIKYKLNIMKMPSDRTRQLLLDAMGRYLCHRWRAAARNDGEQPRAIGFSKESSETPPLGESSRTWETIVLRTVQCD